MTAPRNNVAVIAALAPRTIGYLYVPLTASQRAVLDDIELRTGVTAQALVLDMLGDVFSSMAPRCAIAAPKASARTDEPSAVADIPSIGSRS